VYSTEDAEVIYRDATALDLVDSGYAWIVTEQALLPHNTPIGCVFFLQHCLQKPCSLALLWSKNLDVFSMVIYDR